MNRVLIAVATCEKFAARANACRKYWADEARRAGFDVFFFIGTESAGRTPLPFEHEDRVFLNAGDTYADLPAKVKEIMLWAESKGYAFVYKVDDDTFILPERLRAANEQTHSKFDYVGNQRKSGNGQQWYASGFCYGLSRAAVQAISRAPLTGDPNEDRWVGSSLYDIRNGCNWSAYDEKRFLCCEEIEPFALLNPRSSIGKTHIAFAQFDPEGMRKLRLTYERFFVGTR